MAVAPPANGTIASGDGSINCQPGGTGLCGDAAFHQTKFNWGTSVTLTATPAAGYALQAWGGACTGAGSTCTLSGTSDSVDYSVSATFVAVTPPPATTVGRVYGYVKDGNVGAPNVTVTLGSLTVKTNANGAYVFEVAPGSYTLATKADTQYAAASGVAVTVPATDGVADPAGSCFLGGAKQGFWVPTAGQAGAGCLVRQADLAVTRAGTYVASATAPVPTKTLAFGGIAGFGQPASLDCADATGTWTQVSGPTTVDAGTGSSFSFTTPDLATVLAALAPTTYPSLVKEGRPGFLGLNQAVAGALTYSFKCTTAAGGSATVTVPLVAAVNANLATAIRGEPFTMASYKGADATKGLPGVTGPLWAAGADNNNGGAGNPDGSTWRAHNSVQVPAGVILVLDGPATANWKFCTGASDSYAGTCGSNADSIAANAALVGNGTANAWFPVTWTTGKKLYLTSDSILATMTPNILITPQIWGTWDQRSTAGVESCAGCHVAPGEKIAYDPKVCPNVTQAQFDAGTPCYEHGPSEPVNGWLESKHSKAIVDGASNTHFTLQACGGCHTVGSDVNLPATNAGFSAVLGSYSNDFLFEGSDSTLFVADLAAKNAPAAALVNVQCTNCHGPTPSGTNHTASLSSKVCGTCHNGHDPQYEQWASTVNSNGQATKTGHANLSKTHSGSNCGRCHTAQGFFLYAQALVSGNPDKLGNLPPVGAPAGALTAPLLCTTAGSGGCPSTGLQTSQNVEAITCQTCHDPHSLEVRIKDAKDLGLLGGFKISGGGTGALCSACHNSGRDYIVGGTGPDLTAGTPGTPGTPLLQHVDANPLTSTTGPHNAAQADVYYAGNGYLLGQPMPTHANFHADPKYFPDSCADCHVKRLSTATAGTPSNHTFFPDEGTCQTCHGKGATYIASRKLVVNRMISEFSTSLTIVLQNAGITSVNGKLNNAGSAVDYPVPAGVTVTAVAPNGMNLDFTFSNGVKYTGCSPDKIVSGTAPTLYSLASDGTTKVYGNVVKSLYNLRLLTYDGSSGVHNIPFVDAMLDAMVNHLDSGTAVK